MPWMCIIKLPLQFSYALQCTEVQGKVAVTLSWTGQQRNVNIVFAVELMRMKSLLMFQKCLFFCSKMDI